MTNKKTRKTKSSKSKKCRPSVEEKLKEFAKNKRLVNTYGITLKEHTEMLEQQDNVCWICKSLPPSGRLCVDHIHVKGFKTMEKKEKKKYLRGLLCFLCNTGLKGFEKTSDGQKNRQRLEGTYKYFQAFNLKGEI